MGYLSPPTTTGNGKINDDITHHIDAEWTKWRLASESCVIKMYHQILIQSGEEESCEMGMLRWMCGHTRKDKIRNEDIQDKVGVASVVDKISEARLKMSERLVIVGLRRGRGSPNKYWTKVIRMDMVNLQLTEDMTLDKRL
ncbi:hypothetical protein H5410_035123 [Solanum commersonii]|uniref:Uncharacterized protein n=1 Tax=Solanum commersonii TaxID=4109 RepID=A0A9J5XZT8_SOLCO|nr:hypothetical protein H5410_035123 [Solanum commersonii]